MIQHILQGHMAAGIREFCVITSPEKPQIRDFLTGDWKPPVFPFEKDLRFFQQLERCEIVFLTQEEPIGVADAISLARDFIGNEPFVCIMPDCILFSDVSQTQQTLQVFQRQESHVIGMIAMRGADGNRFGNVGLLQAEKLNGNAFRITSLTDKTGEPIKATPGALIHKGFGGGIYLPEFFDLVEVIRPQARGEVDDVPIHQILIKEKKLLGVLLEGAAFDAGHPLGLKAAGHFAGRPTNCPPLLP
jgi:UTP--glucose-1-phosphate uridylyltransferase